MLRVIQCIALMTPFICSAISLESYFETRRALRQAEVHRVKSKVTKFDAKKSLPDQSINEDEERYKDLRGSFGKTLRHDSSGFIEQRAFQSLVKALVSESPEKFDQILLGLGIVKLVNPQASLAFSLSANDGWINAIEVCPSFTSAEAAGEMVELYWTVLVRDVPFNEFDFNAVVASAIDELNTLSNFQGPKENGVVTPGTFLRGNTPGDLVGPYISQFLYQTIPYGATVLQQTIYVPLPGLVNDFMTDLQDWYTVIDGGVTGQSNLLDPMMHFIRTPRDLGEYVHRDFPGQAFLNALLLLNSYGSEALDRNNPYLANETQIGFVTYGIAEAFGLLIDATVEALKAAWYQKWQVNRRCRPEEYGFYVHKQIVDKITFGISAQLINSEVLPQIFSTFGSYLLPQAYPEGCPAHPSYPAGHATVSGACTTILKAFYDEDFELPFPVMPNATNTELEPYPGVLRAGDELNKLASNISLGRDHAGVHYRSDGYQGLLLGEQVAIDVLNNASFLANENFEGFTFTKFDGTRITVGAKR